MSGKMLHIATITNAHGIKGWMKARCQLENPEDLRNYTLELEDQTPLKWHYKGIAKGQALLTIEHIHDRTEAEKWKGTKLYTHAAALPETDEDEFYLYELHGLDVLNDARQKIGSVKAVHNYGAGDIIEMVNEAGESYHYALNEATFPEIEPDKGYLLCIPPEEL